MRTSDVAAFLGVSRQRVDQLEALGRLPPTRLVAGHRMLGRAEIEAWADQDWWDSKPWRRKARRPRRLSVVSLGEMEGIATGAKAAESSRTAGDCRSARTLATDTPPRHIRRRIQVGQHPGTLAQPPPAEPGSPDRPSPCRPRSGSRPLRTRQPGAPPRVGCGAGESTRRNCVSAGEALSIVDVDRYISAQGRP